MTRAGHVDALGRAGTKSRGAGGEGEQGQKAGAGGEEREVRRVGKGRARNFRSALFDNLTISLTIYFSMNIPVVF